MVTDGGYICSDHWLEYTRSSVSTELSFWSHLTHLSTPGPVGSYTENWKFSLEERKSICQVKQGNVHYRKLGLLSWYSISTLLTVKEKKNLWHPLKTVRKILFKRCYYDWILFYSMGEKSGSAQTNGDLQLKSMVGVTECKIKMEHQG